MITCINCGEFKEHAAKGLCRKCYSAQHYRSLQDGLKRRSLSYYHKYKKRISEQRKEKYYKDPIKGKKDRETLWNKNPERNWAASSIRNHNQRKKFEVVISINELENKAKNTPNCIYCNKPLNYLLGEKAGRTQHNSPCLDRISGSPFIAVYNTVICCLDCSNAKGMMTLDQWKEQIRQTMKQLDNYEGSVI